MTAYGWLSAGNTVSQENVKGAFLTLFPHDFLVASGIAGGGERFHWAARMMRPGLDIPYVPIKHALLEALLGETPPPGVARFDHLVRGPARVPSGPLDNIYARAAALLLKSLLRRPKRITTEEFLRSVGCWGAYTYRRAELPRLRAIVQEFRQSTLSVKQVRPGKRVYRSTYTQ